MNMAKSQYRHMNIVSRQRKRVSLHEALVHTETGQGGRFRAQNVVSQIDGDHTRRRVQQLFFLCASGLFKASD
jgi:hypothetical protein